MLLAAGQTPVSKDGGSFGCLSGAGLLAFVGTYLMLPKGPVEKLDNAAQAAGYFFLLGGLCLMENHQSLGRAVGFIVIVAWSAVGMALDGALDLPGKAAALGCMTAGAFLLSRWLAGQFRFSALQLATLLAMSAGLTALRLSYVANFPLSVWAFMLTLATVIPLLLALAGSALGRSTGDAEP